ncbi:substrate-binding domain-containing protein [Streptomyces gobitricini]|uniref:LacI family DNA-binding transcriptional regulator n=1 Tax=Streptomyces gobitricini TaxID=68211 RepID=A0ABP5ZUW8_9ACTN
MTKTDWRLFGEPFFSEVVRAVGDALSEEGLQLLLTLVRTDDERRRLVEYVRGGRVDGVLLMSVRAGDVLPDMLADAGLPTVLLGRRSGDVRGHGQRRRRASRSATWPAAGRKAIAAITGPPDMYVAQCRLRGYREELADAGLREVPSLVAEGDFTEASGLRAMGELIEGHPEVDAVFAASDSMAAGALTALLAAGRSVPEDVAVVGFDDFELAEQTEPPLTTVRQPMEEIGRTMVRLLLEEMEEPEVAWRHVILRTRLMVRGSA